MLLYLKMKILNKALLTPNLWLFSSVRSSTQLLSRWHGFNPFTPKISLVILFNDCHTIPIILEFVIGSTNNPLIDISLYSHHLSA